MSSNIAPLVGPDYTKMCRYNMPDNRTVEKH